MLKMGCAKLDVTPDFPVYLRGYGSRNSRTVKVENPIEAGVIALEQDGKKVLIITADIIGIYVTFCRRIAAAVKAEFGIDYPDIYIAGSHTHFAPGFEAFTVTNPGGELDLGAYPADERYFEFWLGKVKNGIRYALADLEEVSLESAVIPVSSIAFNRRTVRKADGKVTTNYIYPKNPDDYHFSPIDQDLHVWRFMKANRPKALLARYSCHPVTGGAAMDAISGDYPGMFKQAVQEHLGCPGFFLLGTAGDVVPMRRNGASRRDLGEVLASTIRLNELVFRKTDDFKLAAANFTVPGKLSRTAGYDRKQKEARWQAEVERAKREMLPVDEALIAESYRYDIADRYPSDDVAIPVQMLRLGHQVLVGLPFEVLSAIGLELRAACPEALVTTITGGYEGYLPLAADFPKGGYETDQGSNFAPATGNDILNACIEAVKKFRS